MPAIGHMHTSSSASGSAGLLAPHGRGPAPFRPHNAPAAAGTTRPRAVPSASPAPQRSAIAQQQRRAMQPARAAAVDVAAPAPTPSAQPAPARPAGNPSAPTFQQAITKLQEYWASVGCAIYLPHNTEVGAGTMNPATFLRVLGPEPWNVAYPEPSIRPDDSRYGDNPNRLQRHTQFQVILKPDPGNSQVTTQPAAMPVQCIACMQARMANQRVLDANSPIHTVCTMGSLRRGGVPELRSCLFLGRAGAVPGLSGGAGH